jgi:hypothetical protein
MQVELESFLQVMPLAAGLDDQAKCPLTAHHLDQISLGSPAYRAKPDLSKPAAGNR